MVVIATTTTTTTDYYNNNNSSSKYNSYSNDNNNNDMKGNKNTHQVLATPGKHLFGLKQGVVLGKPNAVHKMCLVITLGHLSKPPWSKCMFNMSADVSGVCCNC